MKRHVWHLHRAANNDLTAGDRVADALRNLMASWPFIIGSLAYMGAWIVVAKLRLAPIDNPQLTYLNLVLSCAAALSSSIILLSQKRSDVIASEVAVHTQGNTDTLLEVNRQQLEILSRLDGLDSLHGQVADLADVVRQVMAQRAEHDAAVAKDAHRAAAAAESAFAATQVLAAHATGPQPALPDPEPAPEPPAAKGMGARVPKTGRGKT